MASSQISSRAAAGAAVGFQVIGLLTPAVLTVRAFPAPGVGSGFCGSLFKGFRSLLLFRR